MVVTSEEDAPGVLGGNGLGWFGNVYVSVAAIFYYS